MPITRIDHAGLLRLIAEDAPAPETDATADTEKTQDRGYLGNEPLESCMKRWDPGTHMTKDAWRKIVPTNNGRARTLR